MSHKINSLQRLVKNLKRFLFSFLQCATAASAKEIKHAEIIKYAHKKCGVAATTTTTATKAKQKIKSHKNGKYELLPIYNVSLRYKAIICKVIDILCKLSSA